MRFVFHLRYLPVVLVSACLVSEPAEAPADEASTRVASPRVKICHLPPGNPSNAHTISVTQAALPAHLAHGDGAGPCVCPPDEEWDCYPAPIETDGIGTCQRGTKTCSADGQGYGECVGAIVPAPEVCGDQLDTDCDGVVDDGCTTCVPASEACGNGVDDDCDGTVDEGCVCAPGAATACYDGPAGTAGVGACAAGVQTCLADGSGYGACVGAVGPAAEACGNGVDDNCDGAVDEGCVCAPGAAAACYDGPAGTAGVGACAAGVQTCLPDGSGYGVCVGAVGPAFEICGDGVDNDCDGAVDDGCVGDRAWRDTNRNGVQDAGEPGLAGVVFLLRTASGALVAVATSDATGRYGFNGVPAGTYYVEAIAPAGYVLTTTDAGGSDLVDSDFDQETLATPPRVFVGAADDSVDAGFQPL